MDASEITVRITALLPQEIEFELAGAASGYRRALDLYVDDQYEATAETEGRDAGDGATAQVARFATGRQIRSGRLIELSDNATGAILFSTKIEMKNFVFPLIEGQRTLARKVGAMEDELRQMRTQVTALEHARHSSLLLDRLDVFFTLMQEKIDRLALKVSPPEIEPAGMAASGAAGPASGEVMISPENLEGVGLYAVEGDENGAWRWIAPRATLVFRDAAPALRAVRVRFSTIPGKAKAGFVRVSANAVPVDVQFTPVDDGGLLVADISDGQWLFGAERPTTLLLDLTFDAYQPPSGNDLRALAAVIHSVALEH